MLINADLTRPALARPPLAEDWVASPEGGVERRMLERDGGEVARATSLVRYAPASRFPTHEHGGGEEFYVITGTFLDENGAYPAGTYVRNPPGSRHAPRSDEGCVLFVKLRQFAPGDTARVVIDTTDESLWRDGDGGGDRVLPLHAHGTERVELRRVRAGNPLAAADNPGGFEVYLLSGRLLAGEAYLAAGSWLRRPPGNAGPLTAGEGSLVYVKTGHLGGGA